MSLNLPVEVASIIEPFAALFSKRVWDQAQVLLVGAILTTGKRTVTSILGVMGLTQERHFHAKSIVFLPGGMVKLGSLFRVLLMMLVAIFVPCGPIVMGMD